MTDSANRDGRAAVGPDHGPRLAIALADDVRPATAGQNLLVGFHFGAPQAAVDLPGVVSPGFRPIGREDVYECWWYQGEVEHTTCGNVRIASCDEYQVAILQTVDDHGESFRVQTYKAYREIFEALRAKGRGPVVKIWNHFGGINDGIGDAEKYRQFSMGRSQLFEEFEVFDGTIPTGTTVGTLTSDRLSIIALTSSNECQFAENPRQVSAFHYPRQYGPKSPMFSRGGCIAAEDGCLYLISGTAAIVGHESQHPFDITRQVPETLEILDKLCEGLSGLDVSCRPMQLDRDCVLRVYLREPKNMDLVARELSGLLGETDRNVAFLNGQICRRELEVEIDGARTGSRA